MVFYLLEMLNLFRISLKKIYYVDILNIYSSVVLIRVLVVYVINVCVIRFYWMFM